MIDVSKEHHKTKTNPLTDQQKDGAAFSFSRLLALEKGPDKYIDSIALWLEGKRPVVEPESHFLDDRNDLFSAALQNNSTGFLEELIENRFWSYFPLKV